ncbi:hypothetical protein ACKFKG_14430 [Phormidesmis sp. 146-35]
MNSILSEIKNRVRSQVLILTKAEKYIHVGNRWVSETSGEALGHGHKSGQAPKSLKEKCFQTSIGVGHYLQQSKHWVLNTSERALTEAYSAAQILKQIENDHFTGAEVAAIAYSDSVAAYFHLVSKKYLLIIQVRLLEFRVSHAIIDTPSSSYPSKGLQTSPTLDKLKFIDEVLTHHQTQQNQTQQNQQANVARPGDFGFADKQTADCSEQKRDPLRKRIRNPFEGQLDDLTDHQTSHQIGSHWKAIELLQLPFIRGGRLDTPTRATPLPQAFPLQPCSGGNLVANAGMASMLVAGGFAAGGVSTWAALSVQNSLAPEYKQSSSEEPHPNRTMTLAPSAIAAPERMPLESSRLGEKPTQQVKKQVTPQVSAQLHSAKQVHRKSIP